MDAASLNRDCDCVRPVPGWAAKGLPAEGPASPPALGLTAPHLFADVPLFADATDLDAIRGFVHAVDAAAALTRERGALMGFDFHLTPEGPRLIEINTNAGGALLAVRTLDAVTPGDATAVFEAKVADMFRAEWEAAGKPGGRLRSVAILDQDPAMQFLFPEFLLYSEIFARSGIEPVICAPGELVFDGTFLWARGQRVELVYNRWTDFALATAEAAPLRAAWQAGAIALTPNPDIHAALSDKRRLVELSERFPIVPPTVLVTPD
nr:hypothetical protein [Deltaproteobacteria bacterium]